LTAIDFNVETDKQGVTHSNATNPSRVTIVTPGRYVCSAGATFGGGTNPGTVRDVGIRVNGSTVIAYDQRPPVTSSFGTICNVSTPPRLFNAGDYIEAVVFSDAQTAAAGLVVQSTAEYGVWLSLYKVG
jgi:hypothetical protein